MNKNFQMFIGFLIICALGWGLYELIALLFEYISTLNKEIATVIIAGSTTVIISVISVVLGKYYERKLAIEKELREKKIPAYQNLVKFFFEALYEQEKFNKKIATKKLTNEFSKITQELMIWGSDDVIKAWSEFRQSTSNSEQVEVNYKTVILLEDLFKEIRKDIGYKGWNMKKGEILGLFINDIEKELEKTNS